MTTGDAALYGIIVFAILIFAIDWLRNHEKRIAAHMMLKMEEMAVKAMIDIDHFKPIYLTEGDIQTLINGGVMIVDIVNEEPKYYAESRAIAKEMIESDWMVDILPEFMIIAVPIDYEVGSHLKDALRNGEVAKFLVETSNKEIAEFCSTYTHDESDFKWRGNKKEN